MSAPRPLRLLLAEDSEADARLLIEELRRAGFAPEWERVASGEGLRAALGRAAWDVLISDYSMPSFGALQALEAVHERGLDLPVIIVSGTIGEELAVAAMRAGARDYIMKDKLARLAPAIERELAEAAERRRARLLEAQFLQAQKMEAVGRLAGGVAHDFNNLITAISGFSHLALAGLPPGSPARADIEEIGKASERAAVLTRQLLTFSRRQVHAPRVLDLNAVVGDLERLLRRLIGADIELSTRLAEGLGGVRADPGGLEQAVLNLAVNARDAMPDGGRLTIETAEAALDEDCARLHPEARPGRYVMLAVSDTGHGIEPAALPRLFEPFFTTKAPGRGTGLGLASVQGIMKQAGGFVYVYSEPGRGATFKLYLPRVEQAPEAAAAPSLRAPMQPPAGTRVVLVEDDPQVRSYVRRVLSRAGCAVVEAESADAALRTREVGSAEFDLLLTDTILPGIPGTELARRLRERRPGLPVVFMSGYTASGVLDAAALPPATRFLQKPIGSAELLRLAAAALEEAS